MPASLAEELQIVLTPNDDQNRAVISTALLTSMFIVRLLATSQREGGLPVKRAALDQAVCVIPYGQVIDEQEIPAELLQLDWMGRLKSELPISLISIPATHDAGTALGKFGYTRCQVLTIPAQLAVGVRGFDIRLRLVGAQLGVYHNEEFQSLSFESVMKSFSRFLKMHPDELLVMRVREEAKALQPTTTFEKAFAKEISGFASLFYHASSSTEIPTVGSLRGKILVLDNYGKLKDAVQYPNPTMSVQDDYDTDDMDQKFKEIVDNFEDARRRSSGATWNVNYTSSCTLKVDQLTNAQAVNGKVMRYLRNVRGHLGLVFMNFPSVAVIKEILDSNFRCRVLADWT